MGGTGSGSDAAPVLWSQAQHVDDTAHREWGYLDKDLLCQVLSDDPDASLRRAARAVCRAWNTTVGEHLITQLCCDIDHLPSIRHLPGLRHIIVEGVFNKLCGRLYKQQCLFVQARLAASQDTPITTTWTRAKGFPAPRGDLSPLTALPGVQAVTLQCLTLLTRNFQQQAAHLTHLTSLTLHQPQYEDIDPFKGLREALSALPQLKALALINLQESVVQPVLTPAKRQRSTTAAAAAAAVEVTAGAGSSGVETAGSSSSAAAEEGREQRPCSSSSSSGALVRVGSASLGSSSRSAGHVTSTSSSAAAAVAQQEAAAGPSSSSSSSSSTSLPCPWLGNLRSLTIRVVDLPDLKPALTSLTSCTHLDLSHCSLDGDLPSSLGQLTQLKVLDLSYCCSRRLPKSCWSRLTVLTRLSLSGDTMSGASHVPLKELPSLQHVELRDQRLRTKALLGCTGLQVLDMRGCNMRKPAVDTLGTVLRKQPALQKVLYGPRCGLKMASLVERHSGVTWVFDPDWDQPYGGNLGDQWSEDEDGHGASSSSSGSEGESHDSDSDNDSDGSSSSSSSSRRSGARDVVSVSSSDFGSWDDFSSHHSSEDETSEEESDGGSLTWDELEAMAFGLGDGDDAGSLTWDELEEMAFGGGDQEDAASSVNINWGELDPLIWGGSQASSETSDDSDAGSDTSEGSGAGSEISGDSDADSEISGDSDADGEVSEEGSDASSGRASGCLAGQKEQQQQEEVQQPWQQHSRRGCVIS